MNSQAVIDHIVGWLKEYASQAKVKGFVVGVSGGIDSAVVSTLAAKTGLETLLLIMPIRQKPDQIIRAQEHVDYLKKKFTNVKSSYIDLTPTFEIFSKDINVSNHSNNGVTNLALANARSRLRMTTLYYFGQINQLLVTGTGNKVEDFGVGFFTKYGDGGVDISPIADLLKTQVYQLAKALDISLSIQDAEPTDGLWDSDRTDEQQMGASYPELEWAMSVSNMQNLGHLTERQQEVLTIYNKLHQAMKHKINPIPVCEIPSSLLQ